MKLIMDFAEFLVMCIAGIAKGLVSCGVVVVLIGVPLSVLYYFTFVKQNKKASVITIICSLAFFFYVYHVGLEFLPNP